MRSFKQFITGLAGDAASDSADGVMRAQVVQVAAVMLPNEMLAKDRVSRMNGLSPG